MLRQRLKDAEPAHGKPEWVHVYSRGSTRSEERESSAQVAGHPCASVRSPYGDLEARQEEITQSNGPVGVTRGLLRTIGA